MFYLQRLDNNAAPHGTSAMAEAETLEEAKRRCELVAGEGVWLEIHDEGTGDRWVCSDGGSWQHYTARRGSDPR